MTREGKKAQAYQGYLVFAGKARTLRAQGQKLGNIKAECDKLHISAIVYQVFNHTPWHLTDKEVATYLQQGMTEYYAACKRGRIERGWVPRALRNLQESSAPKAAPAAQFEHPAPVPRLDGLFAEEEAIAFLQARGYTVTREAL